MDCYDHGTVKMREIGFSAVEIQKTVCTSAEAGKGKSGPRGPASYCIYCLCLWQVGEEECLL